MTTNKQSCSTPAQGEILNKSHFEYPFFEVVIHGSKHDTQKLAKRFSCATKTLKLRLRIAYEHDMLKSIELGVRTDPTAMFHGEILFEGLISAEEIGAIVQNKITLG